MNTVVADDVEISKTFDTFDQWVEYIQNRGVVYNSWDEVINDPDLQNFPGKVEFCNGELVLSPLPSGKHFDLQHAIYDLLKEYAEILQLKGTALFPPPVGENRVKNYRIPDTGWASSERYKFLVEKDTFVVAPEICVEIDSPSNVARSDRGAKPSKEDKRQSFEIKKTFYFENGALEVWLGDQYTRTLKFYERQNPDKELKKSVFFPDFPAEIPGEKDKLKKLISWLKLLNELKNNNFEQFGYKITKID